MAPTLRRATALLLACASVAAASWLPNIIARDVAIVGGGASGAYAAVRLREDFGQSVVVIEKAGRMVRARASARPRGASNPPADAASRAVMSPHTKTP